MQTQSQSRRLRPAPDFNLVLDEAQAIAAGIGQRMTTAHLLLAAFTVHNPADALLREQGIDEDLLIDLLPMGIKEPEAVINEVLQLSEEIASSTKSKNIHSLHMLAAIIGTRKSLAYTLLESAFNDVANEEGLSSFRRELLSVLSGALPKRLQLMLEPQGKLPPKPKGLRPKVSEAKNDVVVPRRTWVEARVPNAQDSNMDDDKGALRKEAALKKQDRSSVVSSYVGASRSKSDDGSMVESSRHAASSLRPVYESSVSLVDRVEQEKKPVGFVSRAATLLPTEYDLDPDQFPWLTSLGRNLTSMAVHGQLDPTVGRASEIEQLIDVLGKRRANNPCLVGDPGVGKTAIAEGLAVRQIENDASVAPLLGKVIIELDMGRITAGTSLRGSFSERMQGLKKDVERAKGKVVVFIDEIHTLMGAGGSEGAPQDASNELKAALARGVFPCIGSTTLDEYRKHIEADPAMERRFVKILVEEPAAADAHEILLGAAPLYEAHHGVGVSTEAIDAAVELSTRFVHDRKLPGKALDLLDLSMSRAARAKVKRLQRADVAKVCAEVAKIPLDRVLLEDTTRFLQMEEALQKRVIGHEKVIDVVSETIRRNYAGFSTHRPMGSFLFLGSSGVGKTEFAKALADFLYGTEKALIRLDMSEFCESHSVARLVGAPPGYVGHQDGGQLTEAIRRQPHAVVLLDEIEKAHPDILPVLLQMLDEGHLTDTKGHSVTFRHAVIVLTSNLGGAEMVKTGKSRPLGFGAQEAKGPDDDAALEAARKHFAPELWGRLEEKLVFHALKKEEVCAIASLLLKASSDALFATRGIRYYYDDDITNWLFDNGGYDERSGARPMRQAIQRLIEGKIADAVLQQQVHRGDVLRAKLRNDEITLKRVRT
ncbi:MAG: ATP-dependent Clp protease ATP-binding subunit [Deltaproteobacteria bacterium]|nr:ATP-dependent Clp protease ATP-binding subunit [Deltaproteobacteria bacterium]